jgi:hypothetical protein
VATADSKPTVINLASELLSTAGNIMFLLPECDLSTPPAV